VDSILTKSRGWVIAGGIMLAVCILELWPEAKKCNRDLRAYQGIAIGSVMMGFTLAADA
jgi:zinc transporter ZupT